MIIHFSVTDRISKLHVCYFVCFVLILYITSQQFFSHVGKGLPGLNQYLAADKGYNTVTGGENRTSKPFDPQSNALPTEPLRSSNVYSKTCVKWPLKNRQNKDLNDIW